MDCKKNCPHFMSDGRAFTDYRPRCMQDFKMCNFEHRQFMINNAEKLMEADRAKHYNANNCAPCVEPYNQGTMLNEKNMVQCNKNTCTTKLNDVNGLGTGRMYHTTPSVKQAEFIRLKEMGNGVTEECMHMEDDPLYYSYDKKVESCTRGFVPSGMLPKC